MPDLNSIIGWIKKLRQQERNKITKAYKRGDLHGVPIYQARADMLTDILEWEIQAWAKKNTETGQLGPDYRKAEWRP